MSSTLSSLFSTLDASVQALNAQSYAMNITGKNVANLDNPDYSDESVTFASGGGETGDGVTIVGVSSARNALLDGQVVAQVPVASSLSTQQQFLQTAQSGLGEDLTNTSASSSTSTTTSTGTSGLSSALNNFFNSFQSLAAAPTDTAQMQSVLQQASTLTSTFQQTDSNLAQVQSELASQAQSSVADANQQLTTIASLNSQIMAMNSSTPGSAVDLVDEREAAVEKLASDIPITTTQMANGSLQVSMTGASGSPVILVNGATVTGPVAISGSTVTGGASAATLEVGSGSIYGAFSADGTIQTVRSSLDALADQIVTSVNAAYNPSSAPSGNFFDPSGTTAGTIAVSSSLTAANMTAGTGAAGDNSVALAIAGLANHTFSTSGGDAIDGTIGQYYAGVVTGLGQTLSNVDEQVTSENSLLNLVQTQRSNASGVSMDTEMGNLMKYQNAYQASARVFSTVDTLFQTLINTGSP
jgi:flagellar hook-associated protein 1 FlgK